MDNEKSGELLLLLLSYWGLGTYLSRRNDWTVRGPL